MRLLKVSWALLPLAITLLLIPSAYNTAVDWEEGGLVFGPAVSNITNDSAVICWVAEADSWGVVYYGTQPENVKGQESTSDAVSRDSGVGYVVLTNLEPNTTYYVEVSVYMDSGTYNSPTFSFRTAPFYDISSIRFRGYVGLDKGNDEIAPLDGALVFMELKHPTPNGTLVGNGSSLVNDLGNYNVEMGTVVSSNGEVFNLSFDNDTLVWRVIYFGLDTQSGTKTLNEYVNFTPPANIPLKNVIFPSNGPGGNHKDGDRVSSGAFDITGHAMFLVIVLLLLVIPSVMARVAAKKVGVSEGTGVGTESEPGKGKKATALRTKNKPAARAKKPMPEPSPAPPNRTKVKVKKQVRSKKTAKGGKKLKKTG